MSHLPYPACSGLASRGQTILDLFNWTAGPIEYNRISYAGKPRPTSSPDRSALLPGQVVADGNLAYGLVPVPDITSIVTIEDKLH